jgi:hypothetical protein
MKARVGESRERARSHHRYPNPNLLYRGVGMAGVMAAVYVMMGDMVAGVAM